MPVRFQLSSDSGSVIVKELSVGDEDSSLRDKYKINIRILPRRKQRPNAVQDLQDSPITSLPLPHRYQQQQRQQQGGGHLRTAKRTRFSCSSHGDSEVYHLHHYDVAHNDVTYSSIAATASPIPYWICDARDLHCCDCRLRSWNKRNYSEPSYETARDFAIGGQSDAATADDDSDFDDVFSDLAVKEADWGHRREVLRPMNAASVGDQRRQRVSQPLPPRRRTGGPRTGASNAAISGKTERKPSLIRRALTDLEAAEVAAGFPEVYYVGDTATLNAADTARRRAASRKTHDSGLASSHGEDSKKSYDDEEGYYVHVPHDQIAYRYEVFKVLGRGSFGQVVRAFDHKNRQWVALKIVRSEDRFRRQALDEIRMLSLLARADSDGQAHVVRMLDHFEFRRHPCIVFEPLGVDLYEALRRRGYRGFPLSAARRAAYCITRCLALLRGHGIIHCDLKPENVLLTLPPPQQRRTGSDSTGSNINVKVIDFGSSCHETDQLYVYVQSRFYRAPEVILGARYNTAVDMWSLGCIVAELVTGRPLFAGDDESDQLSSQLEYLGMPPGRLLARSRRAAEFFSSSTNLPRYCSVAKKTSDDQTDVDRDLPALNGSVNKSGTYRCPPGSKDLDASLLKIIGREPGRAMDRRHRDYIDFVRRCVEWEPSSRMSPEEALCHPWMQTDPSTKTRVAEPPRYRQPAKPPGPRPASHGDENEYS